MVTVQWSTHYEVAILRFTVEIRGKDTNMVYVISKSGKPLMPTNRHGKVRRMLKEGKAKVVSKRPFTIRLLYDSKEFTQPLRVGVDVGSGTAGYAVADENDNIVYKSNVILRNNITEKMTQRLKYRRNRRNRKTRYRASRFLNRGNSKKKDRLPPTVISKIQSHIKELNFIGKILPITEKVFEIGHFDPHLMKKPDINRHWGYQQKTDYGIANAKAIALDRDNHTCQYCKGKHKDPKIEAHHIVFRSQGGSDEPDNLIALCHTCHWELHQGKISLNKIGKRKGTLKHATQMNVISAFLQRLYPEAIPTYGYITKTNRFALGVEKDHYLDACVIATGGNKFTMKSNIVYIKKCVAKGDYQQTKGIRSEVKIPTSKIQGFRKFDLVKYMGKEYIIKGRMSSGYAFLSDLDNNTVKFTNMPKGWKTPKLGNCKRIQARKSWITTSVVDTQNIA